MTSPNTGPQTVIPNEIPHEVWLNWRESYVAAARAQHIATQLPGLDEQIAKAQARLDWLKGQHKQAGRDMTEQHRRSEVHREMVELWCTKHGRELPAELTEADLQPAQQGLPPALVEPPRPRDERDAGAEPPLGHGVAGETTTQTLIDGPAGGGDADALGGFQHPQPDPGNGNGGPGEGRA